MTILSANGPLRVPADKTFLLRGIRVEGSWFVVSYRGKGLLDVYYNAEGKEVFQVRRKFSFWERLCNLSL